MTALDEVENTGMRYEATIERHKRAREGGNEMKGLHLAYAQNVLDAMAKDEDEEKNEGGEFGSGEGAGGKCEDAKDD